MKLYYIEWKDSCYNAGWKFNDENVDLSPNICKSVGWLFIDKKDYIVIAQSISEGTNAERLTIPKAMITKKRLLKEPK